MALQSAYERFLSSWDPSLLASNASLHYITTLTSVTGSAEIIKHLNSQTRDLKKKEEKVLSAVEGPISLAAEIYTTIEFEQGGGAYLPKLDDNFLTDRVATLPIIHIVTFDADGKIQQIRQSWDQGSLLKLIDVIGSRGRNWPIHDGKDHIKLINQSAKNAGTAPAAAPSSDAEQRLRARGDSKNIMRDPHASLALFGPRRTDDQEALPAVIAPRGSAKPPQRDLWGEPEDEAPTSPTKTPPRPRAESPSKPIAPKAGASKNFAPSRIFDVDSEHESSKTTSKDHSTEHFYRPNPKKYEHFEFGDGEEAAEAAHQRPLTEIKASKHGSQWNFDDFNTPAKVISTKALRNNDTRHWGNSDDEVEDSPVKTKKADKPRKGLEPNFEFVDDGGPEGESRRTGRVRGALQNTGLGLYKNNLYDDENGGAIGEEAKQLVTVANVKDRRKDFDPHFVMADQSPSATPVSEKHPASGNKGPLSEATDTKSNKQKHVGINIGGDGMGGRAGTARQWGFGGESDKEEAEVTTKPSKYRTGKTHRPGQGPGGEFWDF